MLKANNDQQYSILDDKGKLWGLILVGIFLYVFIVMPNIWLLWTIMTGSKKEGYVMQPIS